MPTRMENVLKQTVLVANDLYAAETNNKLSGEAYLEQAMKNANTDQKQLDALEAALAKPENITQEIERFIREARLNFIEMKSTPHPPEPEQFGKIARVYGSQELSGEIALLRFGIGTVFALAVRRSVKQRPEHFGNVQSWPEHLQHVERLKVRKASLLKDMEASLSAADIVCDDRGAWLAGKVIPLKRGWPEALLRYACARPKAKKARVKLAA